MVATWADELSSAALALARQFWRGATMWCIAPAWPEHARHVAVEFVHPVIIGKRALPAVAISGPDPVGALRPIVGRGDVVIAVGTADDLAISEVMRRADAWGLEAIWIGFGARPRAGAADHVLWVDEGDGSPAHDGALVLRYHMLWELTHVCFEHPGLLREAVEVGTDDACVTCSDEGRVGEIVAVGPTNEATVRVGGGVEPVDVTLVSPVRPGELILVHAGTAIALLEDTADG